MPGCATGGILFYIRFSIQITCNSLGLIVYDMRQHGLSGSVALLQFYYSITVSLESNVYTVGESDSLVEVCVVLTPAAFQITVVSVSTIEASATGNHNKYVILFLDM